MRSPIAALNLGDPANASAGAAQLFSGMKSTFIDFLVGNLDWIITFVLLSLAIRVIVFLFSYFRHRGEAKIMGPSE